MIKDEYFELYNGVKIPKIGLGTWQTKSGKEAYDSVTWALQAGYRHVDTAYAYHNEQSVGEAIRDSGLSRNEVFITTKLPAEIKSYDGAMQYFQSSLKNLGTDYIDLYLIHAPWPWNDVGRDCTLGNIEVWKAFCELYKAKKVRAIGVSNFHVENILPLADACGVLPMVNQIRWFVGNTQQKITDYCASCGILIEAYSPFATGELIDNATLLELAEKYGVSVAKICLRYCLQKGTLPLPKSVKKQRIYDNIDVDFQISEEDMAYLDGLYHIASTRPLRD